MNFALRDIYELNNIIWFIKSNFLEAIKYFRLSIGVIVLFEVFRPLRALKTEKKNLRGCRRGAYILV